MALKVLLLLFPWILFSCSTMSLTSSPMKSSGESRRHYELRKVWVRQGTKDRNLAYRKINRMTPLQVGALLISGNSMDGLVAMDLESGQTRWRLPVVNGIEGGAVAVRDRIFVGGSDGKFYAVDAKNGQILWTFETGAESLGEPLLDGNTGRIFLLTSANMVYALEGESGRPLWVYSRQETVPFTIRGGAKPALKGDVLFVGFSDGFLAALNAGTGTIRWDVQLNRNKRFRDIDSSPVLDGDRLYVAGFDDKLYCLSTEGGQVLWTLDRGGYAAVTVVGNKLYYPTSANEVLSVDRESGKIIWTIPVAEGKGIATSLVPYKGLLVYGESRGSLRIVDPMNGRMVSSFEPGRGVFSTPWVDEKMERIYFISNEANVYSIKAGWAPKPGFMEISQ